MNRTVRTAGALIAAASLLAMAGCARDATAQEYAPGDGSQVDTDQIALRNVLVISNGETASAVIGSVTNKTDTADRLLGLDAGSTPVRSGPVELPATSSINFGSDGLPGVPVPGPAPIGSYVDLTFNFENAGEVPVSVLVVANTGYYGDAFEAATGLPRGAEPTEEPVAEGEEAGGHSAG